MYQQIATNKRKTILISLSFITFVLLLGWVFGVILDIGLSGLTIALIISLVMTAFSYYSGDKVALFASGAKPIKKEDNPYVYRMIENLCITSGLPHPKVYLINDPAPNAFATGRDPKHASIALTTGLINSLANEELEGVIAHELSHVKNYDIRVMTIILVLVGTVVLISDWFVRSLWWGGGRRDRHGGNVGAILVIIGLILAILSPLIAQLIQLAVSRKREFLADASGAMLTRYPEGLAGALEKIAAYKQPMLRANNATAHLYIANPFGGVKHFLGRLFSTHPPIEERIRILKTMA